MISSNRWSTKKGNFNGNLKWCEFSDYGGGYPQQQQPTYPMQPYNSYSQMPQGYMYPSQPPQNY